MNYVKMGLIDIKNLFLISVSPYYFFFPFRALCSGPFLLFRITIYILYFNLATLQPIMSSELASFLRPMGWTIEEFAALRTFGVRPPQDIAAADLNEMAEQNAQVRFLFLI